jgi:O-antigen/teichoic acid export membrane protein
VLAASPHFVRAYWERLQASPLGYRLFKGAFWSLAGTLISRILGLFSSVLIARMLGTVGFGELGVIQSSVGMFGTFAGFGLGLTATKHVAELRGQDPFRAGRIIALSSLVSWLTGGVLAALLVGYAPWLATRTLAAPHLSGLLRIGSLLLLLGAINGAQSGALAGFEAFKRIASINLVSGVVGFPIMVGTAWCWGLEGAMWGLVASQALNSLLNYDGLRKEARRAGVPLGFVGATREWHVLWRFSLPALLGGVMVGPAHWVCNTIIVNQPAGYEEMGLFNAANQWRQAVLFLPGLLASVALPMMSNLRGPGDGQDYRRVLIVNLGLSFVSSAVIALPIAMVAPWIMAQYGIGFYAGGNVLSLLCIVSLIMATANVIGQTIVSEGRMWGGFILNAMWATVLISTCFVLRTRGATGLGIANLAAYTFHLVSVSFYVWWWLASISRDKKTALPQ